MYRFLFLSLVCLPASAQTMDRFTFLRGGCASLLTVASALAPPSSSYALSLLPGQELEALGLERFGQSVKAVLQRHFVEEDVLERIRWELQERLWQKLEPKAAFQEPYERELGLAILVEEGVYLYARPVFRLSPLPMAEGRTVGAIEWGSPSLSYRYLSASALSAEDVAILLLP